MISAILSTQIDDYIEVHNYLKNIDNSALLILSSINSNNIKIFYAGCRSNNFNIIKTRAYAINTNNKINNQQFQYLIRNIEKIRENNEIINNYKSVLNSTSIDASTRSNYETVITQLEQSNQMIIHQITNNNEMMQRLQESLAIDNSVILQEIANLRRAGPSNQFIESIDRL